jgi:hypothetical protein
MEAEPEAFADFDLQVEARRFLWLVALVLALVFVVSAHLAR